MPDLASLLTPQALVIVLLLLALLAMVGFGLWWMAFGPRARLRRRIAVMLGGKGGKAAKGGVGLSAMQRRKSIQTKLKDAEATRAKKRGWRLREDLLQAGLSATPQHYVIVSVVSGIVSAGVYWLMKMPPVGTPLVAITMGLGFPKMVLGMMKKRRFKAFTKVFADAIDVIVRGIRSGLPVGECINMIAREMPDPVGGEFRLMAEGQRLGMTLDEVLQRAIERTPTAELRFFAIVLSIQQQTGGNLAETLAKLSDVLRQRKRMRDKVQAMSSEAKSSAGIIGSLPVIVATLLAVVAPEYIGLLFTQPTGHTLIGIGFTIMSVGVFVMKQMINFEI
ncbi:MAG: type II secretion system F family protein [Alphaproteobacteria bacterium]|nr:type II secretion system F family protein [Alphaproteobacteria bacterium]